MKRNIAFITFSFIFLLCEAQQESYKGDWVIVRCQSASDYGMTYQLAEYFVGGILSINDGIYLHTSENEFLLTLGWDTTACELKNDKLDDLRNPDEYFLAAYGIKTILLEIDETDLIYTLRTECEQDMFRKIFFNKTDNKLYLYKMGMFFILERKEV